MPRSIDLTFRQAIEAPSTGVLALVFLTFTHPDLAPPIRVVSDVVDYIYNGNRFLGNFPFEIKILSDDESPPTATLRIQNVDRRIGEVIQKLIEPPLIRCEIFSSDDFEVDVDITENAKLEIGTATVQYSAAYMRLANIRGNAINIEGDLSVWDPTGEPFPFIRATPERLPGLFR